MDAIRRTSTLRRVATTASLALLLIPAAAADAQGKKAKKQAKPPVITSVSPMSATVGQKLTIKGKHFRKGKGKNSVGFKRDGEPVVFLRSSLSTERTMVVPLSTKLNKVLGGTPARFSLRVLTTRFGNQYTSNRLSPTIAPRPPKPVAPGTDPVPTATPTPTPEPAPVCAAGTSESADTDGDLLSDALENRIGTGGCTADTDGDGVSDGYEYRSAVDLNDDEYQFPDTSLPYPAALPYANPLSPEDEKDNLVDYDGDGLSLEQEYRLWLLTTPPAERTLADPVPGAGGKLAATPLSYSDGLQYSKARRCRSGDPAPLCGPNHVGRRVPDLPAANYDRWADFQAWLAANGYARVFLRDSSQWFEHQDGRVEYSILDVDRSGAVDADEEFALDRDNDTWLSDDERDEDADGLSNLTESRVQMVRGYWAGCYEEEAPFPIAYAGTDAVKADTDGDGIRDGADDQDRDDVPNIMELSRFAASRYLDTEDYVEGQVSRIGSGPLCEPDADLRKATDDPDTPTDESAQPFPLNHPRAYGRVNPFNPCLPDTRSRSCPSFFEFGSLPAPFDGSPNWWSLQ